jgi:hypothetical protein
MGHPRPYIAMEFSVFSETIIAVREHHFVTLPRSVYLFTFKTLQTNIGLPLNFT